MWVLPGSTRTIDEIVSANLLSYITLANDNDEVKNLLDFLKRLKNKSIPEVDENLEWLSSINSFTFNLCIIMVWEWALG